MTTIMDMIWGTLWFLFGLILNKYIIWGVLDFVRTLLGSGIFATILFIVQIIASGMFLFVIPFMFFRGARPIDNVLKKIGGSSK